MSFPVRKCIGHMNWVKSLEVFDHGLVLSHGFDGRLSLWDLESYQVWR
jgi:hypothetical protein